MDIVKFDDTSNAENLLPNHGDKGINGIIECSGKEIKMNIAEVNTLLKEKCSEFRALVQGLMDNKELEFFEYVGSPEETDMCASEEGSTKDVYKVNHPMVIISRPRINEVGAQVAPKVIFQKPITFPYKDSKRVPWNYSCNVTIPGEEIPINASEKGQDEGFYTSSRRRYDTPNTKFEHVKRKSLAIEQKKEKPAGLEPTVNESVTEKEVKEFLKFLKHSEYSVMEQLHKQPARISILALLLSSETHPSALMKVLNETYVANDISVNKLNLLVNNISVDNFIFFNDDEVSPGGRGSTKSLHITTRCKWYTLPGVLIDNGSALNVLPLSTLNRLTVDSSHMKVSQNIVRAFDGTERKVMGRIEIPLLIGPSTYEVDFLVMDIKPSYNCLLGRPWIHLVGAVPSSLHQNLKLVTEGRLVTINAEEDIIAAVTSDAPYLEANDETIECSFQSLEFVNATFITEGNRIPIPRLSNTTRVRLRLIIGKEALPGRGLGRYLHGRINAPMMKDEQDRFGLGFKPDTKQKKNELEKKQERRRARLSGGEIEWEPMIFPHISKTFVSGGVIHPERRTSGKKIVEKMLENLDINAT
ncbi:uncharacterized protein [Gossypium hirsutum]|uniref:G-patch domain-containing protein n=1 Tax=Gossypium hirsutum TaxID=3635 RepID=A0ABM2YVM7_GOSHI|nr:uncharacterized protein LOC121208107 [Gossypium hirsutum]